ncbi:MAG: HAMP domain-containing sensor histidine kinase, partial [bacterium]|nr:HAMP domain-containing sensor histidine kinase [bacterium]
MNFVDIFTFGPILILTTILFWLYNREIRKTLEQTRISEQMLAKDRDAMKIEIGERTKELKESRIARMNELAKAAEFGRLSQGLFHDLMTPLTSMVLHAEKIQDSKIKEASDRMTAYISDIRSTLSREESDRECLLREELENIVHLLEYRIRTNGIDISINEEGHCTWHGNPVKLRQIFSNLLSNAIDSFDGIKTEKKKIGISLEKNSIKVEDNGCGIKEEDIEKIFTPFFTTK